MQVAAFASRDKAERLVSRMKSHGIPGYAEEVATPAGRRTRVRAGPYATEGEAQAARARLVAGRYGPSDQRVVRVERR